MNWTPIKKKPPTGDVFPGVLLFRTKNGGVGQTFCYADKRFWCMHPPPNLSIQMRDISHWMLVTGVIEEEKDGR